MWKKATLFSMVSLLILCLSACADDRSRRASSPGGGGETPTDPGGETPTDPGDQIPPPGGGGTAPTLAEITEACNSNCIQDEECSPEGFYEDYDDIAGCVAECTQESQGFIAQLPIACANAIIASARCFGALTCGQLDEWYSGQSAYCASEEAAIEAACDDDGEDPVNPPPGGEDPVDPPPGGEDPVDPPPPPSGDEVQIGSNLCNLFLSCYPDTWDFSNVSECVEAVLEEFDEIQSSLSPDCYTAFLELQTCVANLSCSQHEEWYSESSPNYPCKSYDEAFWPHCT